MTSHAKLTHWSTEESSVDLRRESSSLCMMPRIQSRCSLLITGSKIYTNSIINFHLIRQTICSIENTKYLICWQREVHKVRNK